MWYPGEQGGTALAEILFGAVNPSGHLPATFERRREDNPTFATYYPEGDSIRVVYKEGVFVGYRGYEHNGVKPLFPFGYGLSYTTFKYANLSVAPATGATGCALHRFLRPDQYAEIAPEPTSRRSMSRTITRKLPVPRRS